MPIRIRISSAAGAWRLGVGDRDTRPTEVDVPSDVIDAVRADVHEALSKVPTVVVPGRDAARTATEEAAGKRLAAILAASPDFAARLAYHLGLARGRNELAVLVVDAEDPEARALPWELASAIPSMPPMEEDGSAIVARFAPGQARDSAATACARLAAVVWCPTPDDKICSRRLTTLRTELDALGVRVVSMTGAAPTEQLRTRAGEAMVLHVVAHGARVGDEVQLLMGDGGQAPGAASHVLAPWSSAVELVLLDVCEGGDATPDELQGLAARLVAAGAPAVASPLGRSSVEAADAFAAGVYRGLVAALSIPEAVASGRRAVRGLGLAHPDSRWCNFALYVGDLDTAARPGPVARRWLPNGWATPAPDAAELLDAAHRLSQSSGAGYVGLEHLVQAQASAGGTGMTTQHVRLSLSGRDDFWRTLGAGWVPSANGRADPGGTPRLQGWAQSLVPGFGLEQLWQLICSDPTHGLHAVPGVGSLLAAPGLMDGGDTLEAGPGPISASPGAPGTQLQVLWGPEDGRAIVPEVGDVVGRWSEDADRTTHRLYEGTAITDPYLSRQHLEWVGAGRIDLRRPTELSRGGRTERLEPGEFDALVGDILGLSAVTRLRVR